jgi:hypothetical protein
MTREAAKDDDIPITLAKERFAHACRSRCGESSQTRALFQTRQTLRQRAEALCVDYFESKGCKPA